MDMIEVSTIDYLPDTELQRVWESFLAVKS